MKLPGIEPQSGTSMARAFSSPAKHGPVRQLIPETRKLIALNDPAANAKLELAEASIVTSVMDAVGSIIKTSERVDYANQSMASKAASSEYKDRMALWAVDAQKEGMNQDPTTGKRSWETYEERMEEESVRLKEELREKYSFNRTEAVNDWDMSTDGSLTTFRIDAAEYTNKHRINQGLGFYYKSLMSADTQESAGIVVSKAIDDELITPAQGAKDLYDKNMDIVYGNFVKDIPNMHKDKLVSTQNAIDNLTGVMGDMSQADRNSLTTMIDRSLSNIMIGSVNNGYDAAGEMGALKNIDKAIEGGMKYTGARDETQHQSIIGRMQATYSDRASQDAAINSALSVGVSNETVSLWLRNPDEYHSDAATAEGTKAWNTYDDTELLAFTKSEDFLANAPHVLVAVSQLGKKSDTINAAIESGMRSHDPQTLVGSYQALRTLEDIPGGKYVLDDLDPSTVDRAKYIGYGLELGRYQVTPENISMFDTQWHEKKQMPDEERAPKMTSATTAWVEWTKDDIHQPLIDAMVDANIIEEGQDVENLEEWVNHLEAGFKESKLFYDDNQTALRFAFQKMQRSIALTDYGNGLRIERNSPEMYVNFGVLNEEEGRTFIREQTEDALKTFEQDTGLSFDVEDVRRHYIGEVNGKRTWQFQDMNRDFLQTEDGHRLEVTYDNYEERKSPAQKKQARDNAAFWSQNKAAMMSTATRGIEFVDNELPTIDPERFKEYDPDTLAKSYTIEWRNLSYDKKVNANAAYNTMLNQIKRNLGEEFEKYQADVHWFLFQNGYLRGNEKTWTKPPGWESQ